MYNKRKVNKINDKKILYKSHKNWVVISLALLGALGGGTMATHANADVKSNNQANDTSTKLQQIQQANSRTSLTFNNNKNTINGNISNNQNTNVNYNDVNNQQIIRRTANLHSHILQNNIGNNFNKNNIEALYKQKANNISNINNSINILRQTHYSHDKAMYEEMFGTLPQPSSQASVNNNVTTSLAELIHNDSMSATSYSSQATSYTINSNINASSAYYNSVSNNNGVVDNASKGINYDSLSPNSITASNANFNIQKASDAISNDNNVLSQANSYVYNSAKSTMTKDVSQIVNYCNLINSGLNTSNIKNRFIANSIVNSDYHDVNNIYNNAVSNVNNPNINTANIDNSDVYGAKILWNDVHTVMTSAAKPNNIKPSSNSFSDNSSMNTDQIMQDTKQETLNDINNERQANGAQPLTETSDLDKLANMRAQQASVNFTHYRSDGTTFESDDAQQLGINLNSVNEENLADNFGDNGAQVADNANDDMMNHDADSNWGHRDNILNPNVKYIGIGITPSQGKYRSDYTIVEDFTD